ncbi:ABC-three component system middle component 1 [Microbulbifer sp. TRSA002]|uniref:ABC-three component system middle component 1 n=1 Tax=Microbulbifer sp. TRSA002 TaxID=3243382 RepID=UPI004039C25A
MNNSFSLGQPPKLQIFEEFNDVETNYLYVNIKTAKLQAFHYHFKTVTQLEADWKEIISALTSEILIKEGLTFQRRNTYVLYTCEEPIPKILQYTIENNKFSVRKLIYNKSEPNLSTNLIIQHLNEKILISNIDIKGKIKVKNTVTVSEISQNFIEDYRKEVENISSDNVDFLDRWLEKKVGL